MTTRSSFAQEETGGRPLETKPRRRSPVKGDMTDDTQWASRRERLLQDYKSYALADLKATDEKRLRGKVTAQNYPSPPLPPKRPSPPRYTAPPWAQPPARKIVEYNEGVQTQSPARVEKGAECLLERYPPDDLQYSKLVGNWEHTNPYIWADMLFHRKRMEMEREMAEARMQKVQEMQEKPVYQPQPKSYPETKSMMSVSYPPPVSTPPQESSSRSSQVQMDDEPPLVQGRVPGHFQIRADISKMEYDFASKTREMDQLLESLKQQAGDSEKEHRESLKEFEVLKEEMRLKALEMEIRNRSLQSVLEEPYYYAPLEDFRIDTENLISHPMPAFEPELISSESVFLLSRPQDYQSDVYEGLYDSHKTMVDTLTHPYHLSVSRGEDVVIAGRVTQPPADNQAEEMALEQAEVQLEGIVPTAEPLEPLEQAPVQEGESLV